MRPPKSSVESKPHAEGGGMADLVQMLARSMVNRKQAGRKPYVLILGAGASLSSGCSSYSELVDDFLQEYCPKDFEKLNRKRGKQARDEAKQERFYAEWRRMSGPSRYSFLLEHLGGDPSPGYEHLAWLVQHDYLRLIFSTNLDNHVQRAFAAASMAPDHDYDLIVNALGREDYVTRRLTAQSPPVKLVKLHGTLGQEESYAWLPEEVRQFEDELAELLPGYLNKDVVILGHRMDDRDLDIQFRAKGGEIWFINPGGATDTDFKALLRVRAQSRTLEGDEARFDDFLMSLRTHIEAIERGVEAAAEEPQIHGFLRAIGLPGQIGEPRSRYLHLPELYVKPEEYERIRAILAEHHAVVIAGEPHMGKTYTALHLLWEHFQEGWNVVHMSRDGLAAALQQCGHNIDEFTSRHLTAKCLLHLDDPFGETEYQPLGPLQRDLGRLLHEVRRRGDCALILTSRIGIFSEAMGHLEGAALLRGMGVEADIRVHTSYSEETRRDVLERYLNLYEPPWAADDALRKTALAQVPTILEAPHNLELFARRSEGILQETELLDFARSCREMVPALADWMARLPAEDQLVLLTVVFFPRVGTPAELRAFHRKVLARAYEEGLVEHIGATAWDSALERLSDVVTVYEEGDPLIPALSFVHPSYWEALLQALDASPGLRALWLASVSVASAESNGRWRAMAAFSLARNYQNLDAEGRELFASLAGDEAAAVRRRAAFTLAYCYQNLDAEGRNLLASLAADEARSVRAASAAGLLLRVEELDPKGRRLLEKVEASLEERRKPARRSACRPDRPADVRTAPPAVVLSRCLAFGVRPSIAAAVANLVGTPQREDTEGDNSNLVAQRGRPCGRAC